MFRDKRVTTGIEIADKAAVKSMLKVGFPSCLCGRITLAIAPPTPVPKRARETATNEKWYVKVTEEIRIRETSNINMEKEISARPRRKIRFSPVKGRSSFLLTKLSVMK